MNSWVNPWVGVPYREYLVPTRPFEYHSRTASTPFRRPEVTQRYPSDRGHGYLTSMAGGTPPPPFILALLTDQARAAVSGVYLFEGTA